MRIFYADNQFIRYIRQKMLGGGLAYEQPISTGKRISGFSTRREPSFSLGWDQSNQLNSYQMKKTKNQEITGKITAPVMQYNKEPVYDEALQRQKLQQMYQKLAYENPDIPPEQLEQYVFNYDKQRREQTKPDSRSQYGIERRTPIRQKQSMKDIIFNSGGETMQERRAASRRNNSNMVLGDGYNYFHEGSRK